MKGKGTIMNFINRMMTSFIGGATVGLMKVSQIHVPPIQMPKLHKGNTQLELGGGFKHEFRWPFKWPSIQLPALDSKPGKGLIGLSIAAATLWSSSSFLR